MHTQSAPRKSTRTDSEALRNAADKKSTHKPLTVTGIGAGELITVTPTMFRLLDVDPTYQRGKTSMVNAIIRAIQAGGKVHDPVTLCTRRGSETMWIVDGYQRVCAFQQLKMPFSAMIHKSDSADSEHEFFISMNSKRALSPNVIVKAWTGPSGEMLRRANENPEHPMYNRVNLSQSSNDAKFAASSLARAMTHVIGIARNGRIEQMLSSIDVTFSKSMNRARAEHFLRLLGRVAPSGAALPSLVQRAIGEVGRERWQKDTMMPSKKVIERLRVKQWAASVILVEKYFPVLLDTVRKIWRESA